MGASLWLKSKVFRMTIILQDPSTHEPYEVETIQIEKPIEKKAGVKNQANLVYVFLVLIVIVIIASVAVATTTLPQEQHSTQQQHQAKYALAIAMHLLKDGVMKP